MQFINVTHPYFRIYVPETEQFIEFKGGKLELNEDDPAYATVYAVCEANPNVVILSEAVQCELCGEAFPKGKTAAMQLGKHRKDVHFAEWAADQAAENQKTVMTEVKARQPYACDLPGHVVMEFGSEDALNEHVRAAHIAVDSDDEGNASGAGGNAAAKAPEAAPAAK